MGISQLHRGPAEKPSEDDAEDEKQNGDTGQDHLPEPETPGAEGDGLLHDGLLVERLELVRHGSGFSRVRGSDDLKD